MKKNSLDNEGFISKKEAEVKKDEKKAVKKNKKPGFFKKMGAKIKDVFSELKKVSWPTFKTTLKQTGTVLAVVGVFMVVVLGIDVLLAWLMSLVVG